MTEKKKKITYIKVKDIIPDASQPRKQFLPDRMATLIRSIQDHGIKRPLDVQFIKETGKYLLEDGERRYRAALRLGLLEVPAIVSDKTDDSTRLVNQFHIQQQHESWTPTEKAMAIAELAKSLKLSIREICDLLAMPEDEVKINISFSKIINPKAYMNSNIGIGWANSLNDLKGGVNRTLVRILDKPRMTAKEEEKLEKIFIEGILNKTIQRYDDVTILKNIIASEPKALEEYLAGKDILSKQSTERVRAYKTAKHFLTNAQYIESYTNTLLTNKEAVAVLRSFEQKTVFARTAKKLQQIADAIKD